MPYLIDGNNLRHAGRDRRLGVPVDEAEFIRFIDSFARARRSRVTIVFDGAGRGRPGRAPGGAWLRVRHSGARRSADDLIVETVRATGAPRDITVVTSDRALAARVRDAGGRVMGCRRFARILDAARGRGAGGDEEEKPAAGDMAFWERYFSGDD